MQVLDYIRTNPNWEEDLAGAPYFVTTKWDGNYFLLKYNQLDSDFHLPIVRECRGSIFRKDGDDYICVCHPFDKFGNYGESYCPDIDWESALVQEKLDGSLIKLWYDNGWHWSTNGTINAKDASLDNLYLRNYQELIDLIVGPATDDPSFYDYLEPHTTYMFELVSPYNKVVVHYAASRLVLIGARYNDEEYHSKALDAIAKHLGVERPRMYNIHSLSDAIAATKFMSKDEEGFVVVDKNFNRVKVKSEEWLRAAHIRNNGVVTIKRILEAVDNGELDDMIAYCPEYDELIGDVTTQRDYIIADLNFLVQHEINWLTIDNKKTLAAILKYKGYSSFESGYIFKYYDSGFQLDAATYFDNLLLSKRCDIIESELRFVNKFNSIREVNNGD